MWLFDNCALLVGSMNATAHSADRSEELVVVIREAHSVQKAIVHFGYLWNSSEEIPVPERMYFPP